MTPHPAAEAAYWAVLSRNRIGDTATPERHREALEDYVKTRFGGDPGDALAAQSARIAELDAEVARLREALTPREAPKVAEPDSPTPQRLRSLFEPFYGKGGLGGPLD